MYYEIKTDLPVAPKSPEATGMAMNDMASYLEMVVSLLKNLPYSNISSLAIAFLDTAITAENRTNDARSQRLEAAMNSQKEMQS